MVQRDVDARTGTVATANRVGLQHVPADVQLQAFEPSESARWQFKYKLTFTPVTWEASLILVKDPWRL